MISLPEPYQDPLRIFILPSAVLYGCFARFLTLSNGTTRLWGCTRCVEKGFELVYLFPVSANVFCLLTDTITTFCFAIYFASQNIMIILKLLCNATTLLHCPAASTDLVDALPCRKSMQSRDDRNRSSAIPLCTTSTSSRPQEDY